MWHLTKETNNAAIKSSINQQHKAMIATHAKAKGKSKNKKDPKPNGHSGYG